MQTIKLFFLFIISFKASFALSSEWQKKMQTAIAKNNVKDAASLVALDEKNENESESINNISQNFILYSKIQDNISLLGFAVVKGNKEMVSLIASLYKKRNIPLTMSITSNDGYSPIHLAILTGQLEVLTFFYENCVNWEELDTLTKSGNNVFHLAIQENQSQSVEFLLKINKNYVKMRNNQNISPLQLTSNAKILDILNSASEWEADINALDKKGKTLLFQVTKDNNLPLVEKYIQLGINVDVKNNMGKTCLDLAFQNIHIPIIKVLLNHTKIDVVSKGYLYLAIKLKNQELFNLLVTHAQKRNFDLSSMRDNIKEVFIITAMPDINLINMLYTHFVDVPLSDNMIEYAIRKEYLNVIQFFLQKGMVIKDSYVESAKKNKDLSLYHFFLELDFFLRVPEYLGLCSDEDEFELALEYSKLAYEDLLKKGFNPNDEFKRKYFDLKKKATYNFYEKKVRKLKGIDNKLELEFKAGLCRYCNEEQEDILQVCAGGNKECNYAQCCLECNKMADNV